MPCRALEVGGLDRCQDRQEDHPRTGWWQLCGPQGSGGANGTEAESERAQSSLFEMHSPCLCSLGMEWQGPQLAVGRTSM